MRKIYLLLLLSGTSMTHAFSQDTARFQFSIGANNNVVFTNTSSIHGDAFRKAYWYFGDGSHQVTAPLAGTQHHYNTLPATACLKIFKYLNSAGTDSVITGETCRVIQLTTDSCHANFTDTMQGGTTQFYKIFTALPSHVQNKKPERICWNFGDNHDTCVNYNPAVANNYSVPHHYAQPGAYNVCVTIRYQGGCQSTYCRPVHIEAMDTCRADFTTEPVVASPKSRKFFAQPWHIQQKKPVLVCWNFGDGQDTCIQYTTSFNGPYAVSHTYAQYGQYNVCVKIRYDGGCEKQKCKLTSIPAPAGGDSCTAGIFEIATNGGNRNRQLYATTAPNRVAERICWIFGDGTDTCYLVSNPINPQSLTINHLYPAPGVYHACVRVKYAGGCEVQKCREVIILAPNNICGGFITDSATTQNTHAFKGVSIMSPGDQVISWKWTFGDGSIALGQQASHTYAAGGNYEVCLTIKTSSGCETKICKHVLIQLSTNLPLVLSPNPATSNLHAVFNSILAETVTISIYNSNGNLVQSYARAAVQGNNAWDFNVSNLPPGMYSVVVHSAHQVANALFLKQ